MAQLFACCRDIHLGDRGILCQLQRILLNSICGWQSVRNTQCCTPLGEPSTLPADHFATLLTQAQWQLKHAALRDPDCQVLCKNKGTLKAAYKQSEASLTSRSQCIES